MLYTRRSAHRICIAVRGSVTHTLLQRTIPKATEKATTTIRVLTYAERVDVRTAPEPYDDHGFITFMIVSAPFYHVTYQPAHN